MHLSSYCSSMCVPFTGGFRRLVATLQELTFLFLLPHLGGTLPIQRLHLRDLVRRDLWEMADEMNESPRRQVVIARVFPPGGHAGQPHAVLDRVEDLAVGHVLRRGHPHVRSLGIEVLTDRRPPTAV